MDPWYTHCAKLSTVIVWLHLFINRDGPATYGMLGGAMGGCYVKVAVKSVHCGAHGAPIFSLVAGVISNLAGG